MVEAAGIEFAEPSYCLKNLRVFYAQSVCWTRVHYKAHLTLSDEVPRAFGS
jgi:hypothetical protein